MTATATARARVAPRPAPRPAARAATAPVRAERTTARRAPAPPALRVVEAPPRRFPARAVLTLAVVVVFGSLLVSAMVHSVLVSGQARIDDLGSQIRAERRALEDDRLRLAAASSPDRLAAEAERIGLVVADRQTWIRPGSDAEPVVTGADDTDAPAATDDPDGGARSGGTDVDGRSELAGSAGADGSEVTGGESRR